MEALQVLQKYVEADNARLAASQRGGWDGWSLPVNWCSSPPSDQTKKSRKKEGTIKGCLGPSGLANLHGDIDGHLRVRGVSASTSARSSHGSTFCAAASVVGCASMNLSRRLGLGHIREFGPKYSWSIYIWFSFYLSIFPSFCQMWPSPRLLLVLVAYVATHEVRVHQRLIISPCLPTVKKSQLTEEAIIYKVVYTIICSRWQGVCASPLGGRVPYLIQ